ncbi:hypothetical protein SC171_22450 [Pantoea cypripedii]|uniref:hypothetical protein n=1 Tax=Pantoea cypripedii TaxID=55209 RepID=UPI002FCA0CE7
MALHNFTLALPDATSETEGLEDALFIAGCSDALVYFNGTSVYLEFDRESDSLNKAITTAIRDVEGAGFKAQLETVSS